ncbi:MAG: retropepsin-like aspartic protease [Burkholderiaceae bacterium]
MPRTFKVVTVWLLLGLLLFLAAQWWSYRDKQMRFVAQGDVVEIRRGGDGHYHWPGKINGRAVDFLVDTGATGTAISTALARELRLESLGEVRSNTAGGVITGYWVRADVVLQGGVSAHALRVVALPDLGEHPLLGMDVLSRLRWQQSNGRLRVDLQATGTGDSPRLEGQ